MPRNGDLFSREKAHHMRHVRAAIGRRLREQYGTGAPPMPDRLADLARKIEQCEFQSEPALEKSGR